MIWLLKTLIFAAIASLAVAVFLSGAAVGSDTYGGKYIDGEWVSEHPACEGFIPAWCSCTHNSCYVVEPGEMVPYDEDRYLHRPTGRIEKRTHWSKDGKFYRCAWSWAKSGPSPWNIGRDQPAQCLIPPKAKAGT